MVQRLVWVGPEDLYRTLQLLSHGPLPFPQALESLRHVVDDPLESLLLAEEVGLCQQEGLGFRLTEAGEAWLNSPWEVPSKLHLFLLENLPFPEALDLLIDHGPTLPLVALLPLFPKSPRGEKAARALAEWGALLGYWDLVEDRIERW